MPWFLTFITANIGLDWHVTLQQFNKAIPVNHVTEDLGARVVEVAHLAAIISKEAGEVAEALGEDMEAVEVVEVTAEDLAVEDLVGAPAVEDTLADSVAGAVVVTLEDLAAVAVAVTLEDLVAVAVVVTVEDLVEVIVAGEAVVEAMEGQVVVVAAIVLGDSEALLLAIIGDHMLDRPPSKIKMQ